MSVTCARHHRGLLVERATEDEQKRETALVLYNALDARHSDDEVFLLVGLRRYDAHLFSLVFRRPPYLRLATSPFARHACSRSRSHIYVFCVFPQGFSRKKGTADSIFYFTLLYPIIPYYTLPYPSPNYATLAFPALPYPRHVNPRYLHLTEPYLTLGNPILPCPTLS